MTQSLTDVIAEAMWPTLCGEDDLPLTKASSYQQRQARKAAEEALQAIDQAGYKIIPEIRHESAQGRTIEEMRANISPAMLGAGDAKLMWVNEGDLLMLYMPPAMLSASKEGITE